MFLIPVLTWEEFALLILNIAFDVEFLLTLFNKLGKFPFIYTLLGISIMHWLWILSNDFSPFTKKIKFFHSLLIQLTVIDFLMLKQTSYFWDEPYWSYFLMYFLNWFAKMLYRILHLYWWEMLVFNFLFCTVFVWF